MSSTRFPDKPMKEIHGMPMIGHCYHRTAIALGIDNTYVATCDVKIAEYINSIGGQAIMTANSHTRATTRTAEALEKIENKTGEKDTTTSNAIRRCAGNCKVRTNHSTNRQTLRQWSLPELHWD